MEFRTVRRTCRSNRGERRVNYEAVVAGMILAAALMAVLVAAPYVADPRVWR